MYFTNLKKKLVCECIMRTSHFHSMCSHVRVLRWLTWWQDCHHPYHLLASPRKKNVGFARTTWEFTKSASDLAWSFGFLVFHFSLSSFEWGTGEELVINLFWLEEMEAKPKRQLHPMRHTARFSVGTRSKRGDNLLFGMKNIILSVYKQRHNVVYRQIIVYLWYCNFTGWG